MRHRFHALCPYFAMFPESFAESWIDRLTKRNDVVLDPFCGRGTAPFQALLMNRRAVACDVNHVAYCVTKAKTNAPRTASPLMCRLTHLERQYEAAAWEPLRRRAPKFFKRAFHAETLRQILFLRAHLQWRSNDTDCMLAALLLGVIHGESHKTERCLSNRMPRTISTKPDYSVRFWDERELRAPKRNAFEILRGEVSYRYESDPPDGRGTVLHSDMRQLPSILSDDAVIRHVITSPPYFNVTRFEEDQWLRLWFLGGPPRPTYGRVSRDDRHEFAPKYWDLISDLWRMLGQVLGRNAHVVIRIGGMGLDVEKMPAQLLATSIVSRRKVELVEHEISQLRFRQTRSFLPDAAEKGCSVEVDAHFLVR